MKWTDIEVWWSPRWCSIKRKIVQNEIIQSRLHWGGDLCSIWMEGSVADVIWRSSLELTAVSKTRCDFSVTKTGSFWRSVDAFLPTSKKDWPLHGIVMLTNIEAVEASLVGCDKVNSSTWKWVNDRKLHVSSTHPAFPSSQIHRYHTFICKLYFQPLKMFNYIDMILRRHGSAFADPQHKWHCPWNSDHKRWTFSVDVCNNVFSFSNVVLCRRQI